MPMGRIHTYFIEARGHEFKWQSDESLFRHRIQIIDSWHQVGSFIRHTSDDLTGEWEELCQIMQF